jgi:hypothetical protein
MLHEGMCSCLHGTVYAILVLVTCCTALDDGCVFVD